jgi:hypothetical protein
MDIEASGAVDTEPGRPEVPATADSAHAAAPDEAVVGVPADEDPARSATPGESTASQTRSPNKNDYRLP